MQLWLLDESIQFLLATKRKQKKAKVDTLQFSVVFAVSQLFKKDISKILILDANPVNAIPSHSSKYDWATTLWISEMINFPTQPFLYMYHILGNPLAIMRM